jgi:hypothetical protein
MWPICEEKMGPRLRCEQLHQETFDPLARGGVPCSLGKLQRSRFMLAGLATRNAYGEVTARHTVAGHLRWRPASPSSYFRSATGQELISQKAWPRLFSKAIQAVDNHSIRIVRTISATTMTPKLNKRIRRSYDCMLSPAVSEIRLAAPANPLAFTSQIFQFLRIASQNYHSDTQTSITPWGDALRGINIPRFGVTRGRGSVKRNHLVVLAAVGDTGI